MSVASQTNLRLLGLSSMLSLATTDARSGVTISSSPPNRASIQALHPSCWKAHRFSCLLCRRAGRLLETGDHIDLISRRCRKGSMTSSEITTSASIGPDKHLGRVASTCRCIQSKMLAMTPELRPACILQKAFPCPDSFLRWPGSLSMSFIVNSRYFACVDESGACIGDG